MERKRHKHHRNYSPHDSEEHKRKKSHKRHYSESSLSDEEDSNKRKHHKYKREKGERQRHGSGNREDDNDTHFEEWENNRGRSHRSHNAGGSEDLNERPYHNSRHNQHNSADRESRGREEESRQHRHRPRRASAEFDPSIRIKREKEDHNFREQQKERLGHDQRRREARRERERAGGDFGLNTEAAQVKMEPGSENPEVAGGEKENTNGAAPDRQQPNFELSGKLTEDTNTFRGVVIKYNEPPEAMKPKRRWRLYPFKGQESLPVLHIHRQSAFLLGRDRRIADIPVDHPSCSKQQAVLQFRAMPYTRPDGTPGRRVRPYIIDLESANGTYINGDKVEARRYYELREKDVIKFGFSSREYVLLHDAVDLSEVAAGEDMEEA